MFTQLSRRDMTIALSNSWQNAVKGVLNQCLVLFAVICTYVVVSVIYVLFVVECSSVQFCR